VVDELGYFGPDSVAWRILADPSVLVGGLRALLIQGTHPLAMAGVDQHSDYRDDPWGRLRRTTGFVMTVVFGSRSEADAAGARVRGVHRHVEGVDGVTGRPYAAGDPELLAWVHNVVVHSFLTAYRRYGGWVSAADADRFVAEMGELARQVGLVDGGDAVGGSLAALVPVDVAGLRRWLRAADGLQVTPAARDGMHTILAPPMPALLRPVWAVPAVAAVSLLPGRIRAMYGLPWFPPAEPLVRVTTATLVRTLRIALPDPPPVRAARARRAA